MSLCRDLLSQSDAIVGCSLELEAKRLEDVAKRITGFDVLEVPSRTLVREGLNSSSTFP